MLLTTSMILPLAIVVALALVFSVIYYRVSRAQLSPTLRPLTGVDTLRQLADRSIEEGLAMHLALGTGRLTDSTTAETLMGFVLLDQMAEQAIHTNQRPVVTTADPVSQIMAADHLRGGDVERGWRTRTDSRFVAPHPSSYGAGTRGMIQREELGLTAAVGAHGDEYLFLGADRPNGATPMYVPEVAGTARIETLPLIYLTARSPLLGEEIFALGAYLGRWPAHLASVILQDVARVLLIVTVLAGVAMRSLGLI